MIVGIIGKPNVGKSTFFNAATLQSVPMANYPFTTIKPNFGIAYITAKCVCKTLGVEDKPRNSYCIEGTRFIPIKMVDIAGLVKGASEGRGLGNKFLDDLRQADALIHVVDASGTTDQEGLLNSQSSFNPLKDIEFVEREFDLWLKQIVQKDWYRIVRSIESVRNKASKILAERFSGLGIKENSIITVAEQANLRLDRLEKWNEENILNFCSALREKSKPSIIAANKADLPSSRKNVEQIKSSGRMTFPCAAEAELLLRRASEKNLIHYIPGSSIFKILNNRSLTLAQLQALDMVRDNVLRIWNSTGIQQTINSAYLDLLEGIIVYPVEDENKLSDKKGNVLPDAYVMKKGSTARDLACMVHSEIGKTFLYAVDVVTGNRLGANHVLEDSNVIKIVSTAKKG